MPSSTTPTGRGPLLVLMCLWGVLLGAEHLPWIFGDPASTVGSISGLAARSSWAFDPKDRERKGHIGYVSEVRRIGDIARQLGMEDSATIDEPGHSFDELGFRNRTGSLAREPEVVVIGNSFSMYGGTGFRLHEMLEDLTGLRTYSAGITGSDRQDPPGILFDHPVLGPYFVEHPPQYVIWTIGERALRPANFLNFLNRTDTRVRGEVEPPDLLEQVDALFNGIRDFLLDNKDVSWMNVAARKLFHYHLSPTITAVSERFTPRTSIAGTIGETEATGPARRLSDSIAEVPLKDGSQMLFLTDGIRQLQQRVASDTVEQVAGIVAGITNVRNLLRERGIELIVVVIPEKSTVYRRFFDGDERFDYGDAGERRLQAFVREARLAGVAMVDLLPTYKQHNAPGKPWLYYPTDTHWSIVGRQIAAEKIAPKLKTRRRGVSAGGGAARAGDESPSENSPPGL